jgi:hypothetical protein
MRRSRALWLVLRVSNFSSALFSSAILKTNLPGSQKNHPQYRALLILLNEDGLVMNYTLTRGESLQEAKGVLEQAKSQSGALEMIITGKQKNQ